MDANFRLSQLLLDLLIQNGCKNFIFCPGARNSPLIRALFSLSPSREIRLYSHFDERGAGFFALGIAKRLRGLEGSGGVGGAAVITTSGTAVANLYPAMVEAYYSDTPLIAITADRPARLQNLSANQTIEQRDFFKPFTRVDMMIEDAVFDMNSNTDSVRAWREVFLDRVTSKLSSSRFSGPVHINCPFDEPLLTPDAGDLPIEDHSLRKERRNLRSEVPLPKTEILQELSPSNPLAPPVFDDPRQMMEEFSQMLGRVSHGLVVLGEISQGQGGVGEERGLLALIDFLVRRGWQVIVEVVSGMRGLLYNREGVIRHYHYLLEHKECREHWRVDGVLHLGGRLLSKSLSRFLQDLKGIDYIHIDSSSHPYNPDGCVTRRFQIDPLLFSEQVQQVQQVEEEKEILRINPSHPIHHKPPAGVTPSIWNSRLTELDSQLTDFVRKYVFRGFNELEIARIIGEFSCHLFEEGVRSPLFVGNSMPIRNLNAMGGRLGFSGIFSNRGVSGIDGLIATAAGVFRGGGTPSQGRSYAIIGDLSALHDINSLALCREEGHPITVIVINNREGMIFRHLPIAEVIDGYPDADRFYYRHDYGFSGFANSFSMGYRKITTQDDLRGSLEELRNDPRSWLLELEVNPEVHWEEQRGFQNEIMKRIGDGLKESGNKA